MGSRQHCAAACRAKAWLGVARPLLRCTLLRLTLAVAAALCAQKLKRLAAGGKLVRVKASFKLSEALKKVRGRARGGARGDGTQFERRAGGASRRQQAGAGA